MAVISRTVIVFQILVIQVLDICLQMHDKNVRNALVCANSRNDSAIRGD